MTMMGALISEINKKFSAVHFANNKMKISLLGCSQVTIKIPYYDTDAFTFPKQCPLVDANLDGHVNRSLRFLNRETVEISKLNEGEQEFRGG